MNKKKGFTLIELLVVIAIIGLLLSILLPGLRKAKKQARRVVCQANLRQWGTLFGLYTQDNDNKFYRAWTSPVRGHEWVGAMAPYYQDPKMNFCPDAVKIADGGTSVKNITAPNQAWGRFPEDDSRTGYANMAGSYGINDWVGDPTEGFVFGEVGDYWKTPLSKGAGYAPLFLDARWLGGMPMDTDTPPTKPNGDPKDDNGTDMIRRYCIDRHSGEINTVFVDFHVDRVAVKDLWDLKWHQNFIRGNYRDEWPDWMKK